MPSKWRGPSDSWVNRERREAAAEAYQRTGAGWECDECGQSIPETEHSGVSRYHLPTCSLHPQNVGGRG